MLMSFRVSPNGRERLKRLAEHFDTMTNGIEQAVEIAYLLGLPDTELIAIAGTIEFQSYPSWNPMAQDSRCWRLIFNKPRNEYLWLGDEHRDISADVPKEKTFSVFADRLRENIVNYWRRRMG